MSFAEANGFQLFMGTASPISGSEDWPADFSLAETPLAEQKHWRWAALGLVLPGILLIALYARPHRRLWREVRVLSLNLAALSGVAFAYAASRAAVVASCDLSSRPGLFPELREAWEGFCGVVEGWGAAELVSTEPAPALMATFWLYVFMAAWGLAALWRNHRDHENAASEPMPAE